MKIAWVTRSFLDYRIPVFRELDRMTDGNLHLTFSGSYVPESVTAKAVHALGERAYPLTGEMQIGGEDQHHLANRNVSLRWQPGLVKHITSLDPDVIVADGFFKWTLPAILHRLRYGTPLVIAYERTRHTERNAQGVRTLYRKQVVKLADAMDCSGELCREYTVRDLGMDPARITTGHMSADTEGLEAAADALTPPMREAKRGELGLSGVAFLYVGRLDERKGIRELLDGWAAAGFAAGEATLLLVGDGPLRAEMEARVADMRGVKFAGRVAYDELPPYYAAADAFVISTLEDNWSLVVPEAMATGLPILSSVHNGCWPELVRPENGWTFAPENTNELASALRAAQSQGRDALAAMGRKSREIVSGFGPTNAARSIIEACRIAMAHRGAR
ncbi:glycosyltransferase family 4 protein [Aurantiacibacter poecillastricola]|uniref:glycosyltransferase family 4 protein n=1 Tax=Aurantiacibacter poecillastricola TaxID=3064385 RepID=UPI00273D0B05|nr:glycosyltransferase family 4 protein [Aurantiacibacter sp. 219JJ12-13]MDP5260018.1 glycosyltransferase family 4 protein [Aurantiacibacter sp. 219JJ12-13]